MARHKQPATGYEPLVARLANKLRSLPADKKAALVAQLEHILLEVK
jgi:hypothetical protein